MASNKKKFRSKRSHYRFDGGETTVTFKTEFEDGTAKLINISAGGAALVESTLPLTVNTKILITIEDLEAKYPYELQAVVLRVDGSCFSVKFLLLEDDLQKDLLKYFARITRQRTAAR